MNPGDPRRELVERAREAGRALRPPAQVPDGARLSEAQWTCLHEVIEGMLRSLAAAEVRLCTEIDGGARGTAYRDCERALVATEQAARVVQMVLSQRADLRLVEELQLADRFCLDGCETVLGHAPLAVAPPVVLIEPNDGPAMTPPDTTLAVPSMLGGGEKLTMSLPFVYVPRSYVRAPWKLSTLQHEIGHELDHLLGITAQVSRRLELPATADSYTNDLRKQRWRNWLKETVADVWGVVLGGADFAWTLALILDGRGVTRFSVAGMTYPPDSLRIAALAETLRQLGLAQWTQRLEQLPAANQIIDDEYKEFPQYHADVPAVVKAVLSTQTAAGAIRAVVNAQAQDQAIDALARVILDRSGGTELPAGARVRHLASAARRALDREPVAAEHIARRVPELSRNIPGQPWVLSAPTLKFLQEAEYFQPTLIEAAKTTWKSPPVQLLEAHETIAFVGATNHQLLAKLQQAERHHPYARLELFFLRDESLAWLVTPKCDLKTLVSRRDEARRDLAAYLRQSPAPARSWAFYLYSHPHFFASFWDWEQPQGRVHVSPYIWGLDMGDCPGIDFVRGTTPPHRYLAYVSGLEALRRLPGTELIDQSDP